MTRQAQDYLVDKRANQEFRFSNLLKALAARHLGNLLLGQCRIDCRQKFHWSNIESWQGDIHGWAFWAASSCRWGSPWLHFAPISSSRNGQLSLSQVCGLKVQSKATPILVLQSKKALKCGSRALSNPVCNHCRDSQLLRLEPAGCTWWSRLWCHDIFVFVSLGTLSRTRHRCLCWTRECEQRVCRLDWLWATEQSASWSNLSEYLKTDTH